ncbi:MAG: PEP-CTERM sorting domain-containing protein [Sphingomonas sp.]|nr:MAG: PEP-CTERM sorting domain-containing protein [Sphingomonas sp.]
MFSLSAGGAAAGLGSGPFGTVSVTESWGSLIFSQTLASGYRIHDGNANHNAFSFSLVGDPAITISALTSGFAVVTPAGVTAPPFGSFDYAIDCTTACGPGYGGGFDGTLSFTVTANSGLLSLASLDFNTVSGANIYFTTDLVNGAGSTGNIGATAIALPEPASWAMFIIGFGLVGSSIRRRKAAIRFA